MLEFFWTSWQPKTTKKYGLNINGPFYSWNVRRYARLYYTYLMINPATFFWAPFRSNYVFAFLNTNNFFQRFFPTFQRQRQFHKESYIHTIFTSPKVGTCVFLVSFLHSLVASINKHFPHSTNERWKTKKESGRSHQVIPGLFSPPLRQRGLLSGPGNAGFRGP